MLSSPPDVTSGDIEEDESQDGDLSDLLSEMRMLLPGSQTLTAFLIILPFNGGFAEIQNAEKGVYLVTFICSIVSLVCFAAPAAQHRLQRPLRDREGFKNMATHYIAVGLAALSLALVLATQLVLTQVLGIGWVPWAIAAALAMVIGFLWWFVPWRRRIRLEKEHPS